MLKTTSTILLIISTLICISGCFTAGTIAIATDGSPKYKHLEVKQAFITEDYDLIINGCLRFDDAINCKEYTAVINYNKLVNGEYAEINPGDQDHFYILPQSIMSKGQTLPAGKVAEVRIVNDFSLAPKQILLQSTQRDDLAKENIAIIYAIQSWSYDATNYNGWLLVSDHEFPCGKTFVKFGLKAEIRRSNLQYLLLTPITLVLDIVTMPVQIYRAIKGN